MSMTLYFAKLNLVSEELFYLYDHPEYRKDIAFSLYDAVMAEPTWQKENVFIGDDGEPHSTYIDYSIRVLNVDQSGYYLEGWVYKASKLYYKVLDPATNKLITQYTDNTEGNRFTLDLQHGFVGYNTSNRFGYKEFPEAFVNLINAGEKRKNNPFEYSISQCTSGFNMDDIKDALSSIGRIKELRVRIQPPNPSNRLLADMQEDFEGMVQQYKDARVTEQELFYSSKGSSGIDLDSELIQGALYNIQNLHRGLSVEESTQKGYVAVEATSTEGRKFSSGEEKPLKMVIEGVEFFMDACKNMFQKFM